MSAEPENLTLRTVREMRREMGVELAGMRTTLRRFDTDMTSIVNGHAALLAEMRAMHDRMDAAFETITSLRDSVDALVARLGDRQP